MQCNHDWRLYRVLVVAGQQAGVITLCDDCRELGVIRDPSPLEIRRTIAAADDRSYKPVFTGARDRIALLGQRAPQPPAAPEMTPAKMLQVEEMRAKRLASIARAKRTKRTKAK